jgi:hypothetical protein
MVLQRAGRVVGAILQTRDGDVTEIEVNTVVAARRRGWANVMLLEATARNGVADGVACNPQN